MTDWITGWIEQTGYIAICALMFAENLFPPIPSELVMPLSGYTAGQGDLNIIGVILAGTVGSVAGAYFWYLVGRWVGTERVRRFAKDHGAWLTLSPREVDKADAWFDRYGGWAVFVGRLIPAVRTLISVPAGVSEMQQGKFLLFTTAGTVLWTALLAFAGYLLGENHDKVSQFMDPVSYAAVGGILAWYFWRVWQFKRRQRKAA